MFESHQFSYINISKQCVYNKGIYLSQSFYSTPQSFLALSKTQDCRSKSTPCAVITRALEVVPILLVFSRFRGRRGFVVERRASSVRKAGFIDSNNVTSLDILMLIIIIIDSTLIAECRWLTSYLPERCPDAAQQNSSIAFLWWAFWTPNS